MGNRAVIATKKKDLGVYVHWNGGRESIEAFLEVCKSRGYRSPETDSYGWARLCQVIGTFFGGNMSVGISKYEALDLDNGDNGVYIIKSWEIVDREYSHEFDEKVDQEQKESMIDYINTKLNAAEKAGD